MIVILLSALAASTGPAAFQSTETLDRLVEQFAGALIGMEGGARAPVDKRLRLAACDAPQLSWRSAAEDAVRVAAAFDGDTAIGEARFRTLIGSELAPTSITSVQWYSTLDTLTLRVTSALPVIGPLLPITITTTASAYHERWP